MQWSPQFTPKGTPRAFNQCVHTQICIVLLPACTSSYFSSRLPMIFVYFAKESKKNMALTQKRLRHFVLTLFFAYSISPPLSLSLSLSFSRSLSFPLSGTNASPKIGLSLVPERGSLSLPLSGTKESPILKRFFSLARIFLGSSHESILFIPFSYEIHGRRTCGLK